MKKTDKVQKRSMETKQLSLIGLMTAVLCILGPISIPLPFTAVPISFTNLAVCLTAFVLGDKNGTISFLVYLLLGAVGIPVFSGYMGGIAKLAGPTGGYLVGFIFITLIAGRIIEKYRGSYLMYTLGIVLGMAISYLLGTLWFSWQSGISVSESVMLCIIPFLPGDIFKIIVVLVAGPKLRKHLIRANII